MEKLLFITNLIPYPLDNGGKIKSHNILKALSQNYNIDLICFANDKNDLKYINELRELTDDIQVVEKKLIRDESFSNFAKDYLKSLFTILPYSVNKYYDKRFWDIIEHKLDTNNYSFIYVDHLPMMVYSPLIKEHHIILDQHNVESLIFKRMFRNENNMLKKILGSLEYFKLKKFEIDSMKISNHIICLSSKDQEVFEEYGIQYSKMSILPIHILLNKKYDFKINNYGKLKILFLGSMSWYPNQNGIMWFIENVWSTLNTDLYELYIVGSKPPESIKKYNNDESIFVTGYVESVDDFIEKCDVSIVPLFIGSGQRVKIIESFGKGIPVISTSIGAEGLEYESGKNIIIANTSEEYRGALNDILKNREKLLDISINAQKNFVENYSADILPEKIKYIIDNSLNTSK